MGSRRGENQKFFRQTGEQISKGRRLTFTSPEGHRVVTERSGDVCGSMVSISSHMTPLEIADPKEQGSAPAGPNARKRTRTLSFLAASRWVR
jgi:hypothetical protein